VFNGSRSSGLVPTARSSQQTFQILFGFGRSAQVQLGRKTHHPIAHGIDHVQVFAQLIVQECLDIAKNWDDQLVNAKLVKESNAVGIVAYRIARQFGVEE
jgi:hypothetical protein